jgi:hypothetical protein
MAGMTHDTIYSNASFDRWFLMTWHTNNRILSDVMA